MSNDARLRAFRRRQVDEALSHFYRHLTRVPEAFYVFDSAATKLRSSGFFARSGTSGVAALQRASRFQHLLNRTTHGWSPTDEHPHRVFQSLLRHLFDGYEVPQFLMTPWFDDFASLRELAWTLGHLRGRPFRVAAPELQMTRRMERRFLSGKPHEELVPTFRRAELETLGAGPSLIHAILATELGWSVRNQSFWRTVIHWMVNHQRELPSLSVGPIVDFIDAVRHESRTYTTPQGELVEPPPEPGFSIKGRTVDSLMRRVERWHGDLSRQTDRLTWEPSPWNPLTFLERREDPNLNVKWEVIELTTSSELRKEGAALRHCVSSYAYDCHVGRSRIWSVRRRSKDQVKSCLTLEVSPLTGHIVQVRGFANKRPTGWPLEILRQWASREGLQMAAFEV